jgi:class 3 adenylate cyclase
MSATPDSTLANPEQLIADLQRQLAECKAERDEGLERETATAEVLQVINSSPGDLAPVFDAILYKAQRLCSVDHAALELYDGERMHAVAVHGASERFAETLRHGYPAIESPASRALLEGQRFVEIADASQIDHVAFRTAAEVDGVRTVLFVPLRREEALLGMIASARREVRPFIEKEIALLENFGAQAVIAMENARLITETREALEKQTATAEILRVISGSPTDLQPTFDAIAANATILSGAEAGGVFRFDGSLIHFVTHYGYSADVLEAIQRDFPIRPGRHSTTARAILTREVAHIPDAAADPEYALRAILQTGVHTMLSVPVLQDGNPVGAITVTRREIEPFSQAQIDLLKTFADQAVIAIENVRLFNETREALEQQTATAEVLQVINSSPGDLAPVFDAMLEKAMTLCEAAFGFVRSYDGEKFDLAASRNVPVSLNDFLVEARVPTDINPLGRVVRGETIIHVPDIRDEAAYQAGFPGMLALADLGGCRTALWVALRKGNALLGVFIIYRQEIRPFSEKQIALVQAVIAIENARLLGELRQRTEEVAELNRGLEARVAEQVDELGRVGRLKRFLAPQLAELIVSHGDEKILESHRRDIVVVFCDLRGYTAFTETAEPEEVLDFLREYHGALGPLVSQFEGTLDQFSGDGIMVFFNDPVPCPDPAERAVKMAMAMREEAVKLIAAWRRHGSELGFGAGIAQGYATLGQIGFSERSGYTAIGTVCNLAARLCAEAKDGQILVSSRIAGAVEAVVKLEDLGNLELKGLRRPVATFNVVQSTSAGEARPNLTVVARGPGPA